MRQEWEPEDLIEVWTLLEDEVVRLRNKTGANRLGFALLLKFFEVEARFPENAGEVPAPAVAYVAQQVKVPAEEWAAYDWQGRAITRHRTEIRTAFGFRAGTEEDQERLAEWLAAELRVAMSLQWLRAGRANPQLRRYSLRWASGIWACQVFWVVFAFGHWPGAVAVVMVLVGCAGELAVPVWANRLPPGRRAATHPEHIEERYGLFTLIILGEMVLGASEAFNGALEDHAHSWPLVTAAVLCAVLAFLLWWLYFGFLGHYDLSDNRTAFIWGFGHYFVFASLAAADGALGALIDAIAETESALPGWGVGLTLAAPGSVFLLIASLMRAAAGARLRGWWMCAAAVVLGPAWALAVVCAVLAVLLAAQIIDEASGARAG